MPGALRDGPQVVFPTFDFHEHRVDIEGIAIASVLLLQSSRINRSELDAPEADGFSTDSDPSLSQQVFNIAVAQVRSIVTPDSARNDIRRESVAFIGIHRPNLPSSGS